MASITGIHWRYMSRNPPDVYLDRHCKIQSNNSPSWQVLFTAQLSDTMSLPILVLEVDRHVMSFQDKLTKPNIKRYYKLTLLSRHLGRLLRNRYTYYKRLYNST